MSLIHPSLARQPSWFRNFLLLFRRPARLQVAALCRRVRNGKTEVLLVTTKTTRRWILPKGWPIQKFRAHRTAEIEAFEEAGVTGKVHEIPFASFQSHKGAAAGLKLKTEVLVYLIDAEADAQDFPESGKRKVRWVSIDEAIKLTDEPGLIDVLQRLKDISD